MNQANLQDYYSADLLQIKRIIISTLKDSYKEVQTLTDESGATSGKLLRPALVMIGGGFAEIDRQRLYKIGAAVEMLHLATLIHDDIIDEAATRRGKATLNSSFGTKAALYTGDYIFTKAYTLLAKNCSAAGIVHTSETINEICRGEIEQFFSAYSLKATIRSYLKRIKGKSASLFSLSLSIGASEGSASTAVINKLKHVGYYMGMAFQLTDDVLDITSPDSILGKPSGNDLREGTYTFPVLYELQNKNKNLEECLRREYIKDALELLKKSEGLEKAQSIARLYTHKALRLIDTLPTRQERHILTELAKQLLFREN